MYLLGDNKEEGQVLIFRENISNQQYVGMSLQDILCFGTVYANRRVDTLLCTYVKTEAFVVCVKL